MSESSNFKNDEDFINSSYLLESWIYELIKNLSYIHSFKKILGKIKKNSTQEDQEKIVASYLFRTFVEDGQKKLIEATTWFVRKSAFTDKIVSKSLDGMKLIKVSLGDNSELSLNIKGLTVHEVAGTFIRYVIHEIENRYYELVNSDQNIDPDFMINENNYPYDYFKHIISILNEINFNIDSLDELGLLLVRERILLTGKSHNVRNLQETVEVYDKTVSKNQLLNEANYHSPTDPIPNEYKDGNGNLIGPLIGKKKELAYAVGQRSLDEYSLVRSKHLLDKNKSGIIYATSTLKGHSAKVYFKEESIHKRADKRLAELRENLS
jgi:hypothetical protein